MRRPRPRSLAGPALALALVLAGCGDDRIEAHLERGEQHLAAGRHAEAQLEFGSALQLDPDAADAHFGLARARLAQGDPAGAYWELEEATRLDPDHAPALTELGKLRLHGKPDQVREALALAERAKLGDPWYLEAWALEARAFERLGRPTEARSAWLTALELAPEHSGLLYGYGEFLRRRGEEAQAEQTFRRLRKLAPSAGTTLLVAELVARDPARAGEAEALHREALDAAEGTARPLVWLHLARFFQRTGQLEKAKRTLEEALEAEPGDGVLLPALVGLLETEGEGERARARVEEYVARHPAAPRAHLLLAHLLSRRGDLEGTLAAADAALAVAPADVDARLWRASAMLALGSQRDDADLRTQGRAVLDAILANDPFQPRALVMRARAAILAGDLEAARADLLHSLQQAPDSAEAHLLLGQVHLATEDLAAARAALERAVALDPAQTGAHAALALLLESQGELELAVRAFETALRRRPDDDALRMRLVQTLTSLGRRDAARTELAKVVAERRAGEVAFARGRLAMLDGDFASAATELDAAWQAAPTEPALLQALIEHDLRRGGAVRAITRERMRDAVAAEPGNTRLLLLASELALMGSRPEEARALIERAIATDPDHVESFRRLARLFEFEGRREEVVEVYEQAVERNPDSGALHFVLGMHYEEQGRREQALAEYEAALRLDPTHALAQNNAAYLLARAGDQLDRALELARDAREALPRQPDIADTLGFVLHLKGLHAAAIPFLREAERGFPDDEKRLGEVRYHLALAYEADGQPAEARAAAEAALEVPAARDADWASAARALLARLPPAAVLPAARTAG